MKVRNIGRPTKRLENIIVQMICDDIWENMNKKQEKEFTKELLREAKKYMNIDDYKKLVAGGVGPATIVTATAGGFGAYIGFAQGISVILGPLGWVASGLFAVYFLSTPNYSKKIVPFVVYISKMRAEMKLRK